MTLRIRHLRLRAETSDGRFGVDIPLANGLMILRAENSRGKSTAIEGIVYALGLERMITTRTEHALTAAMRDRLIHDPQTMSETDVLESYVSVEIAGADDRVATITRWVTHASVDRGLVTVAPGPALSRPGTYQLEEYFVSRPGAAVNPRGFHRWLAEFIGWQLPVLPTRDGRSAPLYMEQVFPLLFVEQRRGWAGIQALMPYFSAVADVKRRATEFLLDLDAGTLETQRQELRAQEADLQAEWKVQVETLRGTVAGHGLSIMGIPSHLTLSWPDDSSPGLVQSEGDDWLPIDEVMRRLRTEIEDREREPVATAGQVATEAEAELQAAASYADQLTAAIAELDGRVSREREALDAIDDVTESLREDLREHQDLLTLRRLGGESLERLHDDCPVCHQPLPETLLEATTVPRVLSPDQTIEHIRRQLELFEAMKEDGETTIAAMTEQLRGLQQRAQENRSRIRALKSTLTSAERSPSVIQIQELVTLRDRLDRLERLDERLLGALGRLEDIVGRAKDVRSRLRALPSDALSSGDRMKLQLLEESFVEQLREYDFGSFSDEELHISEVDYLPRRADFDLQADISASDSIRVVWAYLLGLLEVANQTETNHPGLLILDEPKQQSTKDVSFAALLRRAAQEPLDRQIIFATSEPLEDLGEMLEEAPHTLLAIDGYLLKRTD